MESQSTKTLSVKLQHRVSLVLFLGVLVAQAVAWRVHMNLTFHIYFGQWVAIFFACTGVLLIGWVLALMAARRSVAARWLLLLEAPFLLYGLYMSGLFVYSMFGGRV